MLWPFDGCGWIQWQDPTSDKEVEQHSDRSKMLFHRWLSVFNQLVFDVKCYLCRFHGINHYLPIFAPLAKQRNGSEIGTASILVANVGSEEFNEPALNLLVALPNESRQPIRLSKGSRQITG